MTWDVMDCRIDPADPEEPTVFGACRPGYPSRNPGATAVDGWLTTVREHGIDRVCCLLDDRQLGYYDGLLDRYRRAFGDGCVTHAPIPDRTAVTPAAFARTIRPALRAADRAGGRVVVHCSAGLGRTGQALALWLAVERGYPLDDAVATVRDHGRTPLEAVEYSRLRETHREIRQAGDAPA